MNTQTADTPSRTFTAEQIAKAKRISAMFKTDDPKTAPRPALTQSPAQPVAAVASPPRKPGRPRKTVAAAEAPTTPVAAAVVASPPAKKTVGSSRTKLKSKVKGKAKPKRATKSAQPVAVAPAPLALAPKRSHKAKPKPVALPEPPVQELSDVSVGEDGELSIFSTTNYSKFRFSTLNRHVKPKQVTNIANALRKKNLLSSFPIIINSNYEIMDGQHRFMAAQMLEVPIFYKVDDNFQPSDIADINTSNEKWQLEDFLQHYVSQNNPEYAALQHFVQDAQVHLHAAIGLLYGRTAQPNSELIDKFKRGDFVVKDIEGAKLVVAMRNDFSKYSTDFYTSRTFLNLISRLKNMPEYSQSKMISQIERQQRLFVKCNTIDQYLDMFSDLYNYKLRSENKVNFREISKALPAFVEA